MTLYTGINGVVKELTGVRSGVGGVVKTNSQMYGGVAGSNRRIFPKYSNSDMNYIAIVATSCQIRTENSSLICNGNSYTPYADNTDADGNWHGASCSYGYNNNAKQDYFWNVYSWGLATSEMWGDVRIIFKDGTGLPLLAFLTNQQTKPGLTVSSYDIPFQWKGYGNGTWSYNFRFGNRTWRQIAEGTTCNIKNTVSASYVQEQWDKNYGVYQLNAANFQNSDWYIYMKNNVTSWAGSSTGFGNAPGYNSGTINGVSIPIRLLSYIGNLSQPAY